MINKIINQNNNKNNLMVLNTTITIILLINIINLRPINFANSHNLTFTLNLTIIN